MSLALAIHTYPGANAGVKRHWPYYENAKADEIILVVTTDGHCEAPPKGISQMMIGANLYCIGAHLPRRLLSTLEALIKKTRHDWFAIAEWDVLFFKPIPRDLPKGVTSHLAGGKMPGAQANFFLHTPWNMDRDTAKTIIAVGNEVLASGKFDPSPDLFIGHVCEKGDIPVHTEILKSYSRNTIHAPWDEEARQARLDGAVWCHGVKHADVLETIMKD